MIKARIPAVLAFTATIIVSPFTAAAQYKIDPAHAFLQFRINHLGYSTMAGRFNTFAGDFTWDTEKPAESQITLTIDTASIDTNWAERDKHLREEDFLHVDKFPQATFESTKYSGDANGGTLEGVLTLHGISKPIVLDVKVIGEGPDPWGGYRAGFSATTTIQRADFGMEYELGPAAETMDFDLFIEGIRQK